MPLLTPADIKSIADALKTGHEMDCPSVLLGNRYDFTMDEFEEFLEHSNQEKKVGRVNLIGNVESRTQRLIGAEIDDTPEARHLWRVEAQKMYLELCHKAGYFGAEENQPEDKHRRCLYLYLKSKYDQFKGTLASMERRVFEVEQGCVLQEHV